MRYLITGVNGFSGRQLAARLRRETGAILLGTGRKPLPAVALDDYRPCDLTQFHETAAMVAWARPDVVFHLAGLNGMDDDFEVARVNVASCDNLCVALRASARCEVRLLVVGSAAELGHLDAAALPATEQTPCRPETAYGRAKYEITSRALAEPLASPLRTIVARTFNLIGPGLDPRLAMGSFAKQLAACIRGHQRILRCGNLQTRRDYLDVRDAVEAYTVLARLGVPGQLYNVCSGHGYLIADLLDQLIAIGGIDISRIQSANDVPAGPRDIIGDHRKITRQTGWEPRIGIQASLVALLEGELRACDAIPYEAA